MIRIHSLAMALAIAACAVAAWGIQAKADDVANPREKVETAVPELIRLLEAKDYTTMLKEFVPPEMLQKITEKHTLDEFAKEFAGDKADSLLKVLKSVKDKKPEISPDGAKAKFAQDDANARPLVFVKIDKYWYIAD